jgi:hypothetical protein
MLNNGEKEMVFNFEEGKSGSWYATAENGRFKVTIRTRAWDEKAKKTRLYVYGEQEVDFTGAYEADRADGGPKPRGERPEVDKMFDKLNRQVVRNQKAAVLDTMAENEALAELLAGYKMAVNRKAGCGCGCSPAFVLDGTLTAQTEKGRRAISAISIERRDLK